MHFRWMAILGLAVAMTGQSAEAARSERGPVVRTSPTQPAPVARPVAISRPSARPVFTARGGHVQRVPVARVGTARVTADRRTLSRPGIARGQGRDRGVVASRQGTGRFAALQGREGRGAVMRSGASSGYQSAMLRGPGGRFTAMSACSTQRGGRVCGGSRQVAMRWSGGLAPAAGLQSSCPDGTMATLAVGHENVVRCVPM